MRADCGVERQTACARIARRCRRQALTELKRIRILGTQPVGCGLARAREYIGLPVVELHPPGYRDGERPRRVARVGHAHEDPITCAPDHRARRGPFQPAAEDQHIAVDEHPESCGPVDRDCPERQLGRTRR